MPNIVDQPCELGELRWRVSLASLIEDYRILAVVHAKLTPARGLEFYGAEQLETPFTHQAVWRWRPLSAFDTVLRHVETHGKRWLEVYRVRRITEWAGRHRFICADLELEKVTQEQ
jgi:hypothetical protein